MNPGRTILITGANRGIGLGLTRHFAAKGWRVFATCRSPATAEELRAVTSFVLFPVEILKLEIRDESSVARLAATLADRTDSLDVLVNNAAINPTPRDATVAGLSPETLADALDVNVVGALRMMQAVLPLLRKSENARIINISSDFGSLSHNSALRSQPAYCVSKAALNMLTRRAALDLGPSGITSVLISPGWVKTDMGGGEAALELDEATDALASTIEKIQPSQNGEWFDRFGTLSDYAW
jgi:NAD(P)-dependent dehydrogenase (short-subunit alcohol dehydrogenase family)